MSTATRDAFREIARLRTALKEADQIVSGVWRNDDEIRAKLPENAWTVRLSDVLREALAPRRAT